jgi:cell division protein FtsA
MSEQQLQYYVGIDIGTTAVRCVVGELSSDSNIPTIIAVSRAENTGMRKGNVAHIEEVAQAVIAAVQEAG